MIRGSLQAISLVHGEVGKEGNAFWSFDRMKLLCTDVFLAVICLHALQYKL